jgi:hypothetical protein
VATRNARRNGKTSGCVAMTNPTAFSEDTRERVRQQIRREEGGARFPLGLFLIFAAGRHHRHHRHQQSLYPLTRLSLVGL